MKTCICSALLIGAAMLPLQVSADWFFRGTPNNWATTALTSGDNGIFYICQNFGGDNPRFKISRQENWNESYPTNSWSVEPNTAQLIVFDTSAKRIEVQKVSNCNNSDQVYIAETLYEPRGPYLQTLTDESVIIRWQSDINGIGLVRYGVNANNLDAVALSENTIGREHIVALDGLEPNTRYYYSVGLSSLATVRDGDMFFETAPLTGTREPVRIWVSGDTGDSGANNGGLARTYQSYLNDTGSAYTDVWLMLGDNAYSHGEQYEYQRHLFDIFPKLLKQTALWPTYGNHDAHRSSATHQTGPYFDIFSLPSNGEAGGVASASEAFHSFDHGNIHFVNLDSSESAGRDLENMKNWLQSDLAENAANGNTDWLIAFFHHPPYTKGSHDSDNEHDVDGTNDTWGGVSEMKLMRENFVEILEKYSVDLVLTGHSHTYERSMLIGGHYGESTEFSANPAQFTISADERDYFKPETVNTEDNQKEGTIYVVAGNAAKSSSSGTLDHPIMVKGMRDLGSLVLDVNGLTLNATLITDMGEQKDAFTLTKTDSNILPVARLSASRVNTVIGHPIRFSASNSSDQDGNIVDYRWQINGSTSATSQTFEHTFNTAGDFTVHLLVTDNDGGTAEQSVDVTVVSTPASNFDQTFIRGNHNNWSAQAMTLVGDNLWETAALFHSASPLFKFDRFADWSENYGDSNGDGIANLAGSNIAILEGAGEYALQFNDDTLAYSVTHLGYTPNFARDFTSVFFRGTPNSWTSTAMHLVADNTWEIEVNFGNTTSERFKFFANDKWYGDSDKDGETHSNEPGDIAVTGGPGRFRIRLIDHLRTYSIEKL